MKLPNSPQLKLGLMAAAFCSLIAFGLIFLSSPTPVAAQNTQPEVEPAEPERLEVATPTPAPNPPSVSESPVEESPTESAVPEAASETVTEISVENASVAETPEEPIASQPADKPATQEQESPVSPTDEIQLSFQRANVDMVVKWLAETTGKSVVKHPKVQCQLTIVSSKNLTARDAVTLVYRALALEGFAAIESSNSILLVPEGQEPKLSPQLTNGGELPEGRQKLIKVFPLKHIEPGELTEKVRGVLSEKGTIETDARANQLIVTDYTDNIRLLGELITELDVASISDTVIEIYPLKFLEAEEMASLLNLVLNLQPGTPTPSRSTSRSSSSSSRSRSSSSMPRGVVISRPPSSGPSPSSGSKPSGSSGSAGQEVRLWPDRTSNRLIVAAPKSKLPEVKRLIDLLDTQKPQDVGIRVIQLKHVSAEDLVKEIAPLYQKMSGASLKDVIEVTANIRSNSLIILSSEPNFKAIKTLTDTLDTEEAQERVMQAFQLKNADAEDVAEKLQELNENSNSTARYVYYYPGSSSGGNGNKISVVSDRRRNTVIVQAPPGAMISIGEMISELDKPITDDSLAPRIYPLKYVSAVDIEDVLNELFLQKEQQRDYWDYYYYGSNSNSRDQDAGRMFGKVRITSEPYSNSIIVTSNSPENLEAVEAVLKQLDSPSQAGESTLRVGLRFANASTVAKSINILFAKNGSPPLRPDRQQGQQGQNQQQQRSGQGTSSTGFDLEEESDEEGYFPWLGGQADNFRTSNGQSVRPVSDMIGKVRIVPDQRSNSLLISVNVHYFPQVLKLIEDLDVPTAEVLIEARIVEVASDYLDKLGVRWSPDGSQVFSGADYDNSFLVRSSGQYSKGFGGASDANTNPAGSAIAALASLKSGVLDSTISMDFLIQFLRQNTSATVLAQPQINIKNNETGKLFVGQQVPIPDNNQVNQLGGQNTTLRYKDVGVVLEVTPHINKAGDVALKIHAESSSIVPGQTVLGGAIFDTRNFKTDLEARSGETLVLGGIIQRQVTDTLRTTPFLGKIPGLGWAFKKKDKITREVELMVFLRPTVIRTPEEAKALLEATDRKMPLIRKWREDAEALKQLSTDP